MTNLDHRIGYDDTGAAAGRSTLLLFHAFPLDRRLFDPQREALGDVARIVRLDAPGFGESAPGDGPLRMETIAEQGRALLDRLGIERAIVGGVSMGGYAALAFARLHPSRLSGLFLADTRAGADSDEARANRRRQADAARSQGPQAVVEPLLEKLLGPTTRAERPEVLRRVRSLAEAASGEAIAAALLGMAERPDSTPHLGGIAVPTTIVCGEEDALTPPAESERMHAAIAGSRLRIVAGAGHLANLERPDAVNAALRELVREVG